MSSVKGSKAEKEVKAWSTTLIRFWASRGTQARTKIRQAYRRLAKKYHPDLNPGDAQAAQKMNEINEAYDLLKNPQAYRQQQAQQRAQQQARQAYQNGPQNQGYYNPFDPFGFYGSQSGSEEDSSDPNQNTYYYYWSSNDDPNRQQYQWNYRRPRRSPLGVLGKIVMIWLIIQFLLSMLGSCSVRRYYPSYYYGYTDGSGSAYSDGYTSENASYTWTQATGQNGSRN